MLPCRRFWFCGCVAVLFAVAGCGGDGGGGGDPGAQRDLQKLGYLYHNALEQHRNGPRGIEDLAAVADDAEAQQAVRNLQQGRYVFLWNVKLLGHPHGTDQLVLAYEKDAPTKGGYVLFLDAHVAHNSAQQFSQLPKPKSSR